jgi:hypothetical protein
MIAHAIRCPAAAKLLTSAQPHIASRPGGDMRKIQKFEPLSVMRMAAICYALLGLLEGILLTMMFSFMPLAAPDAERFPRFLSPLFGIFSVVIFPILFAVFGAIGGGLGAVVYNVAARYVGGIEVEVQ